LYALLLVGVVGGLLIWRWGRRLPAAYAVEQVSAQEWRIRPVERAGEVWVARDVDADGTMDAFETPQGNFLRPDASRPPRRWLVVCLDGVPLEEMRRLWERGHLREFYAPSVVVSTFPSYSETALTQAIHADPVPGYEHLYFDRQANRLRGGWWVTLTGYQLPYLDVLDYDAPGFFKALHFILPRQSYRADLGRLRQRFLKSRRRIFLARFPSTDALYHILPPHEVTPLVEEFEAMVRGLYLDARGELGVLLYSDHGNSQIPSEGTPLTETLEQRGWRVQGSLDGARDVVVPRYGLIGFAAVFGAGDSQAQLASDVAATSGVDLAIRADGANGAVVENGQRGRATLEWNDEGSLFRYRPESGDPLELLPVFEKLRAAGRLTSEGAASDGDLFCETLAGPYPDAPARIRDWARNAVLHRADVGVSVRPGRFHGSAVFPQLVNLQGTHGGMDAVSTLGFAMGTSPQPRAMRLGAAIPQELLADRRKK
jgi:hypothetical protein